MRHADPRRHRASASTCSGASSVRTRADRLIRLVGPPRPGAVRPARPVAPATLTRGDRRRPVARLGRPRRPVRCARPCGRSATALASAGRRPDAILEIDTETLGHAASSDRRPRHRRPSRPASDGPGCTPDERRRPLPRRPRRGPRATTASPPSANGSPTATRTRSRPSPSSGSGGRRPRRRPPRRRAAARPRPAARGGARASSSRSTASTGIRSQVVRQYRRLCTVLARELDEPPLPETDAIYRLALARTVDRSLARAATLEPVAPPRPALVVAN